MKRFFALTLIFVLLSASLAMIIPINASADVVEIDSAEAFYNMSPKGNYKLVADITIDHKWNSSNNYDSFMGVFDGNGHTVYFGNKCYALFDQIDNASIKDLNVIGEDILVEGNSSVAGVAGIATDSTFSDINVDIKVSVICPTRSYTGCVGGIVAVSNDDISFTNCKVRGTISVKTNGRSYETTSVGSMVLSTFLGDEQMLGGIVGTAQLLDKSSAKAVFENCENSISIISNQNNAKIGGMVGKGYEVEIEAIRCKNTAELAAIADDEKNADINYAYVGGIVGYTFYNPVKIFECENSGDLEVSEDSDKKLGSFHLGGILGYAVGGEELVFADCKNSGDITLSVPSASQSGVGGTIGMLSDTGEGLEGIGGYTYIVNCENVGALIGFNSGGIIGATQNICTLEHKFTLIACTNEGTVYGEECAGGIAGCLGKDDSQMGFYEIKYSINSADISSNNIAAGIVACIEKIGVLGTPKIELCANFGKLSTKGIGAAGILGYFSISCYECAETKNYSEYVMQQSKKEPEVTIKKCVSAGDMVKSEASENEVWQIKTAIALFEDFFSDNSTENIYSNTLANVDYTFGGSAATKEQCEQSAKDINSARSGIARVEYYIACPMYERYKCDYGQDVWSTYEAALDTLRGILNAPSEASQTDIETAINALLEAIEKLEEDILPIDKAKTALVAKINSTRYISDSTYTRKSYLRVYYAKEMASEILKNGQKVSEFKNAIDAISAAVDKLEKNPPDKTMLEKAIDRVEERIEKEGIVPERYTNQSYDALMAALKEAKQVVADVKAVNADVLEALEALNRANSQLITIAESDSFSEALAGFNDILSIAENLKAEYYTEESLRALEAVIDSIKSKKYTTAKEYIEKTEVLQTALNDMVLVPAGADDVAELNTSIELAQKLNSRTYTEESRAALEEKLKAAKSVAEKSNVSKKDVYDAKAELDAAVKALESKSFDLSNIRISVGCQGAVGATSAVMITVIAIGIGFVKKKKQF